MIYEIAIDIIVVGFSLKFIDDIYDEDRYNRSWLFLLFPVVLFSYLYFGVTSIEYSLLNFGIIFGCYITKKLDNLPFKILGLIGIFPFIYNLASELYLLNELLCLIGLVLSCVADEILNNLDDDSLLPRPINIIGKYRLIAKIASITFYLLDLWNIKYVMFICMFDIGYYIPVFFWRELC